MVQRIFERDPATVIKTVGARFHHDAELDDLPLDLRPTTKLAFEDLAGLFASTSLNHGIVTLTIRELAYLYGLTARLPARHAIEIGRFRGGSTIAIAAAMPEGGRLWSVDIGEKEERFHSGGRTYDRQLQDFSERFRLPIELIVGDSRTLDLDTGEVDLVFIDGDHSYAAVRSDIDRWGRRARIGGAVLLDDALPESYFGGHTPEVRRALEETLAAGDFELVAHVDRMAHIRRIR